MRFFDLHCDTVGECYNDLLPMVNNNLHIDLKRAEKIGEYIQVFAVWISDELRGEDAKLYFNKVSDYFYKELEQNSSLVSAFTQNKNTPVKAVLAAEGGSACGGTIEGLYGLFEKGVRIVTLTWNGTNEIAAGAFSEGGFTEFGKEFVKTAEELGIVLDVSHLNRQGFFEFLEISEKPFIASHSNADIVNNPYGHKRNLTKEQILCIKERNGLIGLNFCLDFIEDENAQGIAALCRQIDYFLSLECENIIAFGSDYDGCKINNALFGIEKIPSVYKALQKKGYATEILDKLFFENAFNFFQNAFK